MGDAAYVRAVLPADITPNAAVERVGVSKLRSFLEQLLRDQYLRNLGTIIPQLQQESRFQRRDTRPLSLASWTECCLLTEHCYQRPATPDHPPTPLPQVCPPRGRLARVPLRSLPSVTLPSAISHRRGCNSCVLVRSTAS